MVLPVGAKFAEVISAGVKGAKKYVTPTCIVHELGKSEGVIGDIANLSCTIEGKLNGILDNIKSDTDLIIAGQMVDKVSSPLRKAYTERYVKVFNDYYTNLVKTDPIKPEQILSQIFGRYLGKSVTQEEAKIMIGKYKSIIEEPDFMRYLGKLFMQLKEDFGLKNSKLGLNLGILENGQIGINGNADRFNKRIQVKFAKDNPLLRQKTFLMLFHEMTHVKQHELEIATNLNAYIDSCIQSYLRLNPSVNVDLAKLKSEYINVLAPEIERIQKEIGIIDSKNSLYKKGMDLIEANKNYFSPQKFNEKEFLSYKKQLSEEPAYETQDLAMRLYYSIAQ